MEQRYLIDTNILIAYTGNILPEDSYSFISNIIDDEFNISVINKIEILGHKSAGNVLEEFIGLARIFELSKEVVNKTIEIRKTYKTKLPDAIIAATALSNNLVLITRNISDFEKVLGLKVIDPYAI